MKVLDWRKRLACRLRRRLVDVPYPSLVGRLRLPHLEGVVATTIIGGTTHMEDKAGLRLQAWSNLLEHRLHWSRVNELQSVQAT